MDDDVRESRSESQRVFFHSSDEVFLYEGGGEIAEELRTEITRVRIGPQVKDIPCKTFDGCINLVELQFDDEGILQVIGDEAFSNCMALQHLSVPSSVTKLGKYAFWGCIRLTVVRLHDGLEVIEACAFRNCMALQQVTIPPSVTKLGESAFKGCNNLTDVHFDEGVLQVIEDNAFQDCTALQQVTIPSSVTELGIYAFRGCVNMTDVHFHDGLQSIGMCGFYDCKSLQHVTIPSSVTKLGHVAFHGCINLVVVQFEEKSLLRAMGNYAFRDCTALQQLVIPPSVTKLGRGAFHGCRNLADVQLTGGLLQNIGATAFKDCTALQQVTIPSSVISQANYAFFRGSRLGNCSFPFFRGSRLGNCSFQGCTNLTEVILLGGDRLLDQEFLNRGLNSGEGALDKKRLNETIGTSFTGCLLSTMKISVSLPLSGKKKEKWLWSGNWRLSQRMARLPQECRLSVEGRIRDMRNLEITQDGEVLACFPVIRGILGSMDFEDSDNQTAKSLHQVLRLISFHELKESSILIELAMWKSRFDGILARADCRTSVPGPAKCLIMEYCGFTDFLEPAIEGD